MIGDVGYTRIKSITESSKYDYLPKGVTLEQALKKACNSKLIT